MDRGTQELHSHPLQLPFVSLHISYLRWPLSRVLRSKVSPTVTCGCHRHCTCVCCRGKLGNKQGYRSRRRGKSYIFFSYEEVTFKSTQAHTHTYTDTFTHSLVPPHSHTLRHTDTHTCRENLSHTYTDTLTHSLAPPHSHIHKHSHTQRLSHTQIHS